MLAPTQIELLSPIQRPLPVSAELAPRLTSLEGISIALLDNSKTNSDKLLDYIAEKLLRDYGVKEVIRYRKGSPSFPADDEVYDQLTRRVGAIITGIGD